jgi:hypothetical protein
MARRLGVTTTTFYVYINGDGTLKVPGKALLDETGGTRRLIESHG